MSKLILALVVLLPLTSSKGPCLAIQTGAETGAQPDKPIKVTQQEADSHRIEARPILRTSDGFPGDTRLQERGIEVRVTVRPDGVITQVIGVLHGPVELVDQAVAAVR